MQKARKRAQQAARRKAKKLLLDMEQKSDHYVEESDDGENADDTVLEEDNYSEEHSNHNGASASPLFEELHSEFFSDNESPESCDHATYLAGWELVDEIGNIVLDDESDYADLKDSLVEDLAIWQSENNVSKRSFTKLLKLLRKHDINVPADADTVLKTPRSGEILIQEKSGKSSSLKE